mgnify:CR=1 FL=1
MKRIIFIISFILTSIIANAQTGCDVIITSNFESQCVLTTEKDDALKENEGLMLACKESQVEYYADTSSYVITYNWTVLGASSYTLINNGAGVRVNWSNGNTGQIKVQVITQDGSICEAIKYITLIEKPQIASSSTPNYRWENGVKVIEVCLGETVTFTNESTTSSTDIAGHFWKSIYSSASTENYTIENIIQETKVTHKIVNNCGCEDEELYEIRILEGQKLELSCYGTVCEGTEVTYEVLNSNCNQYNWFVEGGIIKSGQGYPKITIEWGNPQSGYGILGLDGSLCGEGYCPKPVSVKIPIITDNAEISGQTTACVGDAVVYSLQLWGSTKYTWAITPQQGVYQSQYENANETLIQFNTPGVYYLNANYNCDFLECGPFTSQTKIITVKEKLEIKNERENICLGQSATFTLNHNSIAATWKVYNANNQQIYTAQIDTLVYTPNQAGKYKITAEHPNYCNVAEFNINVKNPPPAPTINDTLYVCPNASVLLQATPASPLYSLVWKSLCSTPETEGTGNEFTVQYLGDTCNVEVYHYDKEVGCLSTTSSNFTLVDFNLLPTTLPTSGITVCMGSTIEYMNDEVPNQSPEVLYEWDIDSAYAATVIGDKTKNNTSILVNNSTLSSFNIILKRKYCTDLVDSITIPVTIVSPPPAPTITPSPIPSVCVNTPVTLTGNGAITNNNEDFSWSIDGDARVYNDLRTITHSFSVSGIHNIELSYHPYSVCPAAKVNATINIIPSPIFSLHNNNNISVNVVSHDGGYYTSYSWTINGVPSNNTTSTLTGVQEGDYICCTVTNSSGCSSEECITIQEGVNPPDCDTIHIIYNGDSICSKQRITVSAIDNPTQNPVRWVVSPSNLQHLINRIGINDAEITFKEVGIYTIIGYVSDGSNCYISNAINVTIPVILDFDVEYNCTLPNLGIKITDKSKYYPSVPTRIFNTYSQTGSLTMNSSQTIGILPMALPPTSIIQDTVILTVGGCTLKKAITLYPKITSATITSTYNNNSCQNVPSQLTVNVNPTTSAFKSCTWNFGDGSTNTSTTNVIDHTFPMGNNQAPYYTYNVSAVVTDENNCSVPTPTIIIKLYGNQLATSKLSTPPLFSPICPGLPITITYSPNLQTTPSSTYLWNLTPPTNNSNTYLTYKTDDYYVRATSNIGCIGEAMINVPFKNKPNAFITCNNEYCLNDKIELLGDAGAGNITYNWDVIAPDNSYEQYSTPNISFIATQAGNYSISLTVDNGECYNTYIKYIDVWSSSNPPTINFAGNQCIHQPPVVLGANAPNGETIHWSNGVSNSTAHYYSPGVALAYYYDQHGCKSKEAKKIIPSAPNFDALLTGCYKRCKIDIPPFLNVYSISKDSINWHWLLDQTQIANGYKDYLFSPLTLPLNGFGRYNLDVMYNNNICNTVSPSLVIEEEDCPCEGIDIKVTSKQHLEECRIIYDVEVEICNNGYSEACLEDLFANTEGINILHIDNFPLNISPGQCEIIKFSFEVLNPLSNSASFRIYDACNKCYIDFSIDINVEILDCEEEMILEYVELYPDFSSQTMAYFKFGIHFPNNPQAIFRVWSEPSQVLNYNFDQGGARIDGLAMFDRNLLEQLAERGEKVCFHVLMCKDNVIRECVICIGAKELLNMIIENGFKSSPIQNENKEEGKANSQQINSPYLVPNPASTYVKVEGIEKDNISEILLIDMQGKNIQKVSETDILDIQKALKGTYIVRVISKDSKVYYLKLIKN